MTTELFEPDLSDIITSASTKHTHIATSGVSPTKRRTNEKVWLINEIILPELPSILDTVHECIDLLNSDQIFTLPISNGGSKPISELPSGLDIPSPSLASGGKPSIQGIVVRQGVFVLDIRLVVSFPNFRKGKPVSLKRNGSNMGDLASQKFPILQLQLIDTTLVKIRESLNGLKSIGAGGHVEDFDKVFMETLRDTEYIIGLLERAPSEVVFPRSGNRLVKSFFHRDYKTLCESNHHMLSLDLTLLGGSIAVDLRNLDKVVKRPWCDIDTQSGLSKVDKIRQQLRSETDEELKRVLERNNIYVMEPSGMINFIHSTFNTERTTLEQARFHVLNCATFDNCVVTVNGQLLVTASDSNLISLNAKLKVLDGKIRNHYNNLIA